MVHLPRRLRTHRPAHVHLPLPEGFDGESGHVVSGADADPARIPRHAVDAIRNRPSGFRIGKVVDIHIFRKTLGVPVPPVVAEAADGLPLFRVHRHDRLHQALNSFGIHSPSQSARCCSAMACQSMAAADAPRTTLNR